MLTLHSFCAFQPDTFLGSIFEGLQRGYMRSPFPISSIRLVLSILAEHDCPCQGNFSCLVVKTDTLRGYLMSHTHLCLKNNEEGWNRCRGLLIFYPDSTTESVSLKSDIEVKMFCTGVWRVSCDDVAFYFHSCRWGMRKPGCPTAESYMSYTGCPSGPSWWLAFFSFKISVCMLSVWNAHHASSPACPLYLDKSRSSPKDLDDSLTVATTFPL